MEKIWKTDQGPLPEVAIDLREDIGLLQYTGGTFMPQNKEEGLEEDTLRPLFAGA
jgi:hypothetical protein